MTDCAQYELTNLAVHAAGAPATSPLEKGHELGRGIYLIPRRDAR